MKKLTKSRLFGRATAGLLTAALLLSGCSGERGTPQQSQPDNTAHIAYPELLPEGYAGSELASLAEECNALLTTDEAVMEADYVRQAIADFQGGKTADLNILCLYSNGNYYGARFYYEENGQLTFQVLNELWESGTQEEVPSHSVCDFYLTDYGYLVYQTEPHYEPTGYKLINDRDLYPNVEERDALYQTYIAPIAYTAMFRDWQSAQELNLLFLYEDICRYEGKDFSSPEDYIWPVPDVAATLSRYFEGITEEVVVAAAKRYDNDDTQCYYPEENSIHYEGGRGGGPFCLRITQWEREGSLLKIHYQRYDYITGDPDSAYILTIEDREDGGFTYCSNLQAE